MDNSSKTFFIILIIFVSIAAVISISVSLIEYSGRAKHIKLLMYRADDDYEKKRFENMLIDLKWSIIPGINPGLVRRLRRKFGKNK